MHLSESGLAAIKRHEGVRLEAYPDPGSADGLPITIGYGSTRRMDGSAWKLGDKITEAEATTLLRRDVSDAEVTVNRLVTVPLTQGQFDALVSFVFNVGAGAFKGSTLLRLLNAGDYTGAAAQFARWVNNDGKPLAGLVRRRNAERAMFEGAPNPQILREAPMAPFIAAALPQLITAIPELIRSFGDGAVTERNAKAAEAVLQVVQTATGTPNAQAAVEAVQSDPAARIAATEALEREHWFETTEAGGGGIAGAREFNVEFADGKPLRMPALWISFALLVPFYAAVFAVLFMDGWSAEIRIQVVTAVLATVGVVSAFWLGSSFATTRRKE